VSRACVMTLSARLGLFVVACWVCKSEARTLVPLAATGRYAARPVLLCEKLFKLSGGAGDTGAAELSTSGGEKVEAGVDGEGCGEEGETVLGEAEGVAEAVEAAGTAKADAVMAGEASAVGVPEHGMTLSSLRKIAMAKLAPLREALMESLGRDVHGEPPLTASQVVDAAEVNDAEAEGVPEQKQPMFMMFVMVIARVGMSLLMLFLSKRRAGAAAAGSGEEGDGASADLFGGLVVSLAASPFGFIVRTGQQVSAKMADFSRSPNAPLVMMALLLLGVRLVKWIDTPDEEFDESNVELAVDEQPANTPIAVTADEAADPDGAEVQDNGEEGVNESVGAESDTEVSEN